MAGSTFTLTDARAPRFAVERNIAETAEQLAADAERDTPRLTGEMAASWRTEPGREPGTTLVVNDSPHAVYVEYGTRNMPAQAPLGRAAAAARARGGA